MEYPIVGHALGQAVLLQFRRNHQQHTMLTLDNSGGYRRLHDQQMELLTKQPSLKKPVMDRLGKYTGKSYMVKIVPLLLFTDDTSGNISSQYNKYDSWSMQCAGLPFELRNKKDNMLFITAIPGSDGVSAFDVIPRLVEDLLELEEGVMMYSAEHGEDILVVAPLLLVMADNPRHSEICGLMSPTSTYPCRKCYARNLSNARGTVNLQDITKKHYQRTKEHFCMAAGEVRDCIRNANGNVMIEDALVDSPGQDIIASAVGYKDTMAKHLLKLRSFDPSKDTSIEILHTLLLGVVKYLVEHLVKKMLHGNPQAAKMKRLQDALADYAKAKGYSRHFRRQLRHVGSFLGRDFKQLIQVLPMLLKREFTGDTDIEPIFDSFDALGKLCSVIFIKSLPCGVQDYLNLVDELVMQLTTALYTFDDYCQRKDENARRRKAKKVPYLSRRLKVHILQHITFDIQRFGCAIQYETEKGEQFNHFIREHLYHTNRHNTSRDVALKFGKQMVVKSILDGASWIINGKRVACGKDVKMYIERNSKNHQQGDTTRHPKRDFCEQLLGGSREFIDNYAGNQNLKVGGYAVLSSKVGSLFYGKRMIIGKLVEGSIKNNQVELYRMISGDENAPYMAEKLNDGLIPLSELNVECVLDMHLNHPHHADLKILNVNKFGSLSFMQHIMS